MLFFLFCSLAKANKARIISLDPAATEILVKLGLSENLVGRTNFCNYPASITKLPSIGDYNRPNVEKILNLKPTHIIAFQAGRPLLKKELDARGIKVLSLKAKELRDYPKILEKLSETFKLSSVKALNEWNTTFTKIKNSHWGLKKGYVFVNANPVIVAGKNTFISQALEICGFDNLAKKEGWPSYSREKILLSSPEIIVNLEMGEKNNSDISRFLKKAKWINAFSDEILRLGPRFPKKLLELCKSL